jgi:hypothetical protein
MFQVLIYEIEPLLFLARFIRRFDFNGELGVICG